MTTVSSQDQATTESASSKTQRRYTVGYLPNRGDTSTPAINLSGKWLREAGFETGNGLTVKIAGDCIVLIPDNNETQDLRQQLKQYKEVLKGLKAGMSRV
ncbi:toxic protein SymE [Yokenella regensburgei]|uniref:Toxic protein SymE n=1 Tax=Yokenella regensburgei TaxID=158877 RepID=A0ABX9S2J3_9ENTR|nr:SymE family type I addiction module toxin [Yokenella regensburgei]RKR63857.1 toxic protein SymE [Yokenella regensburgei]VFS26360.1 Putative endoribonuclease symE [Yokenella regensburgei]